MQLNLKIKLHFLIKLLCLLTFSWSLYAANNDRVLYQVAPLSALVDGIYDGNYTYGELKQHGNFGLGTFDYLDGEMVALDGKFYQMKGDGKIVLTKDKDTTPFAEICYFKPTIKDLKFQHITSFNEFTNSLERQLTAKNSPYAIKVHGEFSYLKLRAVLKQDKLGVPLTQAAKEQKVFEFRKVKGDLVGFWFPQYLSGIAVAGFHFHFISADRKYGGHVLDLQADDAMVDIMPINNMNIYFPSTVSFDNGNLNDKDITNKINQAEKQH